MAIGATISSRPRFGWVRAAAAGLTFRPAADDDRAFLHRLYGSTRADELALLPWSEAEKAAFLDMQFRAQHTHYQRHFPDADQLVIERAAETFGRLYLDRRQAEHHIIDIAILPEHRGKGYGTALISDLIDEAAAAGKPVSIHVEKFNPAMRLYHRLGFVKVEDQGVYDLMRRTPFA